MFKHLLIPTDGSPASDFAVSEGIALALSIGARVTGMHVLPSFHWLGLQYSAIASSRSEFSIEVERKADDILGRLASAATQAGVAVETCIVDHEHVYEGIVTVAKTRRADLIVMASHGGRGVAAVLLGSETQKVLTHTDVPVLVFRAPNSRASDKGAGAIVERSPS